MKTTSEDSHRETERYERKSTSEIFPKDIFVWGHMKIHDINIFFASWICILYQVFLGTMCTSIAINVKNKR